MTLSWTFHFILSQSPVKIKLTIKLLQYLSKKESFTVWFLGCICNVDVCSFKISIRKAETKQHRHQVCYHISADTRSFLYCGSVEESNYELWQVE